MPTRDDWIRLAAFIDGEGAIYVKPVHGQNRKYTQLVISIANCDPRLPMWCKETFGGSVHRTKSNPRHNAKWREAWSWRIYSSTAEGVLVNCLPYFLLKKEQADVALAYRKTFLSKYGKGAGRELSEEDFAKRESFEIQLKKLQRELPDAVKAAFN